MTANELRAKYLEFFKDKWHVVIPSAPLIPDNDPTVLFTTAGMHPLVPFLRGEKHPAGTRLVNYQRCLRTGDIDLVGDDTHLTFFEMLGNWSLGDYFKQEAIEWSWEFLTGENWLKISPDKLSVSVFAGDTDAPRDRVSADAWRAVGMPMERIYYFGKDKNWWGPAGSTGPCGPDTEMFYDTGKPCTLRPPETCDPSCDCGRYIEIWNDVFMEYEKNADGTFSALKQKNVDTGMGLERTLAILNGVTSVYQTEIFSPDLEYIRGKAKNFVERSARIILDHTKAATFLIADGILPSNKDQGYVLRRLIRKVVRESVKIGLPHDAVEQLTANVMHMYAAAYPHLIEKKISILDELVKEGKKFSATLEKGQRYLEKETSEIRAHPKHAGKFAFDLHQTYGFPPEMTYEILRGEQGVQIDQKAFDALYQEYLSKHQDLSRKGAEQKFKGGLADHSEIVIRMHTATHLLHQALKDVLGSHAAQKGSNITSERLRFDFVHPAKMTKEQIEKVESIVNQKVRAALPVEKRILPLTDARKLGATGLFGEKYGETVSVYSIGDYSKEFCGGPHVTNTKDVGTFKILKEEAVSAGIRRIKAVVL